MKQNKKSHSDEKLGNLYNQKKKLIGRFFGKKSFKRYFRFYIEV